MAENYLPPAQSGFVEGTCPVCKKHTFSKGKTNKHKCGKRAAGGQQ